MAVMLRKVGDTLPSLSARICDFDHIFGQSFPKLRQSQSLKLESLRQSGKPNGQGKAALFYRGFWKADPQRARAEQFYRHGRKLAVEQTARGLHELLEMGKDTDKRGLYRGPR